MKRTWAKTIHSRKNENQTTSDQTKGEEGAQGAQSFKKGLKARASRDIEFRGREKRGRNGMT